MSVESFWAAHSCQWNDNLSYARKVIKKRIGKSFGWQTWNGKQIVKNVAVECNHWDQVERIWHWILSKVQMWLHISAKKNSHALMAYASQNAHNISQHHHHHLVVAIASKLFFANVMKTVFTSNSHPLPLLCSLNFFHSRRYFQTAILYGRFKLKSLHIVRSQFRWADDLSFLPRDNGTLWWPECNHIKWLKSWNLENMCLCVYDEFCISHSVFIAALLVWPNANAENSRSLKQQQNVTESELQSLLQRLWFVHEYDTMSATNKLPLRLNFICINDVFVAAPSHFVLYLNLFQPLSSVIWQTK